MPEPEWESLEREVRDLAQRVAYLEGVIGLRAPYAQSHEQSGEPAAHPRGDGSAPRVLPVFGRALLGLAGAYLLRALTESRTLPAGAGVFAGMAYALLWLVWAVRMLPARRLEAAVLSVTSGLVLAPLLWEATLRFGVLPTWTAAGILVLFAVFGRAVSWRKGVPVVAGIATVAAIGTGAGLLMATYDVMPFTFVFLGIAAAVETSACLGHPAGERWAAAAAADLSVLLATWLVTNPHGLPDAYAPISNHALLAAQLGLFAIYLASTMVRTLLHGDTFGGFEILQCVAAFAIGVGGGLRLSHNIIAIGALALACALACYAVSFLVVERRGTHGRNFYVYTSFAMALALVGTRILFAGAAASAVWSGLALVSIWAGGYFGRLTLLVHGGLYLLLAFSSSGALVQAEAFLLGDERWPGRYQGAICAATLLAAAAYFMATRANERFPAVRLGVAGMLVWLGVGISAGVLTAAYHGIFGAAATHAYCATLRTAVLAGSALLLAWLSSRRRAGELSWLIYPVMALGAYRLLVQDLHEPDKAAVVLSLLGYGAALIALPRVNRVPGGA